MIKNIGNIDRIIRAIVGIALIGWALSGGPLWAWLGAIPLVTAAFKFCPAYALLGVKTCPTQKV